MIKLAWFRDLYLFNSNIRFTWVNMITIARYRKFFDDLLDDFDLFDDFNFFDHFDFLDNLFFDFNFLSRSNTAIKHSLFLKVLFITFSWYLYLNFFLYNFLYDLNFRLNWMMIKFARFWDFYFL
jgi:hypothetical protein